MATDLTCGDTGSTAEDIINRINEHDEAINKFNILINGGFDIWERGTLFTDNIFQYTADRWGGRRAGNATGYKVAITSFPDFISGARYGLTLYRNEGDTNAADRCNIGYTLETADAIKLRGKTITLTFSYLNGDSFASSYNEGIGVTVYSGTGIDQVGIPYGFLTGNITLKSKTFNIHKSGTAEYERVSVSFDVPTNSNGLSINFYMLSTNATAGATDYVAISNVKLENGSTSTPYQSKTVSEELTLCQRYYEKGNISIVYSLDYEAVNFKNKMRTNPSIVFTDSNWLLSASASNYFRAQRDLGGYSAIYKADAELY